MAITYAREASLSAAEYAGVLGQTTMRDGRPLGNTARIQAMLDGSNFIVTAREEGELVGLARCLCDFAWVCYCAELAVREGYQGKGIGRGLLDTCAELLGPGIAITLLAYPEAAAFYQRIGMQPAAAFFRPRTDSV
jgi:GNAT superfamily N-acetyltransferase